MFSATTHLEIRNSPHNNSSGKYQWSFSKASRFKETKQAYSQTVIPRSNSASFDATRQRHKNSFGGSCRSKFFDGLKDSVSPDRYKAISEFKTKNQKGLGFNFGYNRDELNFSNYLKANEQTPAPPDYQKSPQYKKWHKNPEELKGRGRSYSMRQKTTYPKDYFLKSQNESLRNSEMPGPGQYAQIDQIGKKYMASRNKNCGTHSFRGKERFELHKSTPSPADFMNMTTKPDGSSFLSTMKSTGTRCFPQQKRELKLCMDKGTPGPGTYRAPSDFGHYDKPKRPRPQTARR